MHYTGTILLDESTTSTTAITVDAPDETAARRAVALYIERLPGDTRLLNIKPTPATLRVTGDEVYVAGLHPDSGLEHLGSLV